MSIDPKNDPKNDSKKLTVKEASEYLGISVPTVYVLLKKGVLTAIKESARKTLIAIEDLDSYKNGVKETKKDSEEVSPNDSGEKVPEDPESVSEESEEISFEIGTKILVSNFDNEDKIIWVINNGAFEPTQVDSEFTGIVENIIQHEGREFVYLGLENGSSKWCILGDQIRKGFYSFPEEQDPEQDPEDNFEEVSEKTLESPSKDLVGDDSDGPTEELKELMKGSQDHLVKTDFEKLVEEDDRIWQLVKSCDQDLKEYIKNNGDGSDTVGYTLELGGKKITYQPEVRYSEFNWPVALEWFVKNRYLIWKKLKEEGTLTKEFIEKVEMEKVIREEIKIR